MTAFSETEYSSLPLKTRDNVSFFIKHISKSNGLPSNVITAIVKDQKGFIWFGTPAGLCRWDGFKTITYKNDPSDSNSLIGDQIPRNGLIWDGNNQQLIIGTHKGISLYHPESNNFKNYYVNPASENSLQSPVNCVFIDRQATLWIGTDHGFSRFRPEHNNFANFTYQKELPKGLILDRNSTNQVFEIKQDLCNDSILWMATLAGLLKFDKVTESLSWFYFPDNDYLRELNQFTLLVPHQDGKLYLGTWNFDMAIFDTKKEIFSGRYGTAAKGLNKLQNRILPYESKSPKEIWVSSLQGLGVLNSTTGQIEFIKDFKNDNNHRFAPELFYVDGEQHLWMGSEYGAFVLNVSNNQIRNHFFEPLDEEHWYLTNCIFEDPLSNELLIGYGRGEGLHFFNRENKGFSISPYERRSINEYNLASILMTDLGEIYGLSSDEIYRYNREEKKLIPLNFPSDNFPAFTDMKLDSEGNIWIASGNLGLQKFNPGNQSLETIMNWSSFFKTGHELPLFQEVCIDSYNRIWFRRKGESYGYYDPVIDSVYYFNKQKVTSFSESVDDTIWVAIDKEGIGFIDTKNPDQGVQLAHAVEIINTGYIEDIAIDPQHRIWCLSGKGLVKMDRNSGKSILFDKSYGIRVHDPWSNKNALVPGELKVLKDGSIVIGYRRGLGFFHPDSLQIKYQTPEPYIISFRVFEEDIPIVKDQDVKLSFNENYISISYSALDLYNQGISLKHKLIGVDKNWTDKLTANEVAYPNLAPGKYTFIVEAISVSGFGDKKELALTFIILPPWWKTVWAISIFIIFISSLLYAMYRFQLKRQLEKRESQRLRELDELKTRLYANITHEFRTPITVIMGMVEELTETLDKKDKQHFLKKLETIERNSSNLLHLVNQMLDLAKLEHGKLNYNPIQANIIPWMQYMVESHQSLAAAKEVQLTFYTEIENQMMDFDTDQLSKVISNLLTNAIKFSDKRGKVIFHVKHDPISNHLLLKVKDDGIGIPESKQSSIFDRFYQVDASGNHNRSGTGIGLSLTREIVDMIGGSIRVKSQPGKGSEFEVAIPVSQKAPLQLNSSDNFEMPFIKQEMPEQADIDNVDEPLTDKEKPLVLIVEDNHDVAGYIRDTIRTKYRVKWASDGEKGLQMAFDLIPDLVITDVMMPGKDGFEVCNILKLDKRTDHIPVVMLTAKVTDSDRISGYERGADAYLTKPFNKRELLVRLEQLLRLRRQLQAKYGKLDLKVEFDKPLSPEEQFIGKVAQIVEVNLERSMFNATYLASEIHLSESQLYRKLKAITGKSTAIFIRTVRLKKAKELLETSNLSISEIAYQVGFNDPAWFSRAFKEEFSKAPSEFRKGKN
jgi:signal transduction histidine kinase/DNA-binding response OmpR family regulator/ligand-binding sensor domain-containing protein